MGVPHELRLHSKRPWSEAPRLPNPLPRNGSDGQLEIAILFTSPEATIGALERTAALLNGLDARINLVAAQTVPYPLALDNPPVSVAFNEQRLFDVAAESSVETTMHLYLCRSRLEMLTSVLKSGSVLMIGVRKRWWPSWERRLARDLESAGFQIILLELS
jgi:hypothetical protein